MNQIFLHQRRKILHSPKTTTESQLQTTRSVASTNQDPPRIVIKTEDCDNGTIQKDNRLKNWTDVFGDFLSEGLLRRKQISLKKNTETAIDRAYLHEVPITMNSILFQSPSIRKNFTKYIIGEITAEEFLNRKNQYQKFDREIPKQVKTLKRPKINVTYRRSAVTDEGNHDVGFLKLLNEKNEEMIKKQQAQSRFDIIRDLIEEKIEKREEEDLVKRSRELKNVGMIKQMYDISDQYIQDLQMKQQEKDISPSKKCILKGKSVNIIQHQNPYQLQKTRIHKNPNKVKYEAPLEKYMIRELVNRKAKEYIQELQLKDYIENEKAKKKIFVNYQFKQHLHHKTSGNSTPRSFLSDEQRIRHIYPFIQKNEKENNKQVIKNQLINNDLELIKYITNYPKYDPFKDKEVQEQIQKELLEAGGLSSSGQIKIKKKQQRNTKLKNIQRIETQNSIDSRSNNESLNSMYEFNVDNLYEQSRKLQSKLLEKQYTDGFSKTIKAIQKNQNLNHDIILKNIQKLEGITPI